jgi:2-polyprenyl-3-methyl-5-hydroxy-6-metoxy-1,4-benzoquinol methylase
MKNKFLEEPCIYCKNKSEIYLKSSKKNKKKKINFTSTEILIEENEIKPNLFYCKNCEIIFSEFCKNKFEENYKDVDDPQYINQISNKKLYFENLINKISKDIKATDDVLEIGSYYGAFGSEIKHKVKSYVGIELSKFASNYAKSKFGLNISNKNIFSFLSNNKKKFDIIFMFDVIEHLDDPKEVIKICSKHLNMNGRIIISTMNMDSIFAKLTGKYYPWIISMHKFYFTDKSMKKLLNTNNLEISKIINDVRIISIEYLFLKISHKISFFKIFYKLITKIKFIRNIKIKFSLFDINIYCAVLKD